MQRGGFSMSDPPTYDRFILKSIMPAEGWQVVYDDEGTHLVLPVHALALAHRVTYECHTNRRVREPWREPAEENWEIVGLTYDPSEAWDVCDAMANYCGLLPPGMALKEFEVSSLCRYAHAAKQQKPA
jgi:hypothetical protein